MTCGRVQKKICRTLSNPGFLKNNADFKLKEREGGRPDLKLEWVP